MQVLERSAETIQAPDDEHIELAAASVTEGATVEVVAGAALVGHKATQKTPCDFTQALRGGFAFDEGYPFEDVTLRASAPGYVSKTQTG
jgi:hypothetical protein